jgi:hypothetical protein
MTSTTTNSTANKSNTTTTTSAKNTPSHEIFLVEGEGKETTWTKVGVAFPTKSGHSHRVFVGKKGDPKQKIYLVCPNSQFDHEDKSRPGEDAKRMPYANIFDTSGGGTIDFKKRDGVAFLNRDDSLTLLIGEKGDKDQQKLQMRDARRFKKTASTKA